MKKLQTIIYIVSTCMACYGFWGCFFPEYTIVEGTYSIESDETIVITNKEAFYYDILEGEIDVVYSSRLWEMIKGIRREY
ncbi:MAG: hypothetical protein R3Y47_06920 [Lachnospiraceae bacterium]